MKETPAIKPVTEETPGTLSNVLKFTPTLGPSFMCALAVSEQIVNATINILFITDYLFLIPSLIPYRLPSIEIITLLTNEKIKVKKTKLIILF